MHNTADPRCFESCWGTFAVVVVLPKFLFTNRKYLSIVELHIWSVACVYSFFVIFSEGPFSWTNHDPSRQPREPADYPSVWFLWRVPTQVRQCQRLEVLHWSLRLSAANCSCWQAGRSSRWALNLTVCLSHLLLEFVWLTSAWIINLVLIGTHGFLDATMQLNVMTWNWSSTYKKKKVTFLHMHWSVVQV